MPSKATVLIGKLCRTMVNPAAWEPGTGMALRELCAQLLRTNTMIASFLMGLVGGQRAMTPLAAVSVAAARGDLQLDHGAPRIIAHKAAAAGTVALAIAEMLGDKQKTAPNRIAPVGLAARFMTSAIAGAALAPSRQRWLGAAVGGSTAVAASYFGWRARMAFMRTYGQTTTGLIEDAAVVVGAIAILQGVRGFDRL